MKAFKRFLVRRWLKEVPLKEVGEYVGHEKIRRGLDEAFHKTAEYMLNTFYKGEGFKTIGNQPNVMNILTTEVKNICVWYDGTMRPMRGHNGDCRWNFDGQIWSHL